jgi:PAS domain S-box-containing protein
MDVTEEREREHELERARTMLSSVFSSIDDAIFVIGPPHRHVVKAANAAVERIFGYKPEELEGRSTEILHESRRSFEEFGRRSEKVLDQRRSFRGEFRMRRRSGETFPTEHVVTILNPAAGWRGGVVSVLRDITERRQAEEELKRSKKSLQAKSRRLQELNSTLKTCSLINGKKKKQIWKGTLPKVSTA